MQRPPTAGEVCDNTAAQAQAQARAQCPPECGYQAMYCSLNERHDLSRKSLQAPLDTGIRPQSFATSLMCHSFNDFDELQLGVYQLFTNVNYLLTVVNS